MFTLPSTWNLIISTLVFFIAAKYVRSYLEQQRIPQSMTRGLLVFMLASLASWGSGEMVDRIDEKISGPKPAAQTSDDLSQLLRVLDPSATVSTEPKEPASN